MVNAIGPLTNSLGKCASVVVDGIDSEWAQPIIQEAKASLDASNVELVGDVIPGAGPNAPREDVFRIAKNIRKQNPDVVVSIGGGSPNLIL